MLIGGGLFAAGKDRKWRAEEGQPGGSSPLPLIPGCATWLISGSKEAVGVNSCCGSESLRDDRAVVSDNYRHHDVWTVSRFMRLLRCPEGRFAYWTSEVERRGRDLGLRRCSCVAAELNFRNLICRPIWRKCHSNSRLESFCV